jgi:hypothetical protein
MDFNFSWSKKFNPKVNRTFKAVQNSVDKQCMEHLREFCPVGLPYYKNSGALRDSAKIAEPGRIVYTSKLARHDYYNKSVDHSHGGNPNATPMWFEPMKSKYTGAIRKEISKITEDEFK